MDWDAGQAAKAAGQASKAAGKAAKAVKKPPLKDVGKLKKQAKAEAKKRAKALAKVLMAAALVVALGFIVYLVKIHGRQPKDALENAIDYAYHDNVLKFRDSFTADSIAMVETSGENPDKVWKHLMDGVTPTPPPEIVRQDIEENKGVRTAEVTVVLESTERTIYMREEDGGWKINLNVAINPRRVTLPEGIPPEYIDNFAVSDEPQAWWEEDTAAAQEGGKENDLMAKIQFLKKLL